MMVKPLRALLLLGYTFILLAIVTWILPTEWKISDQFTFRSFTLRSIFEKETVHYADISDIQKKFEETEALTEEAEEKPVAKPSKPQTTPAKDTLTKPAKTAVKKSATTKEAPVAQSDTLDRRFRIQYPEGEDKLLHAFFKSLRTADEPGQLMRVLHYGDSQVEGDRITAPLRNKLQERFGGCGIGLMPLVDQLSGKPSVLQHAGSGWQRHIVYGTEYRKTHEPNYGILGSYFTYASLPRVTSPADSLMASTDKRQMLYPAASSQQVSVSFAPSSVGYARNKRFDSVKLLYRSAGAPFKLTVQTKTDTLEKNFDSTNRSRVYRYPFPGKFTSLKLTFSSEKSPEFYGVALDCNKGVAVDNISFRGSSGTEFTRMNRDVLRQQLAALNVKCIILQFGVNVVPYLFKNYSFYEQQLYSQLKLLKSLAPDVSILVVGVSDMSQKEGENYVSYPNIEPIRDAQRNAAFKAGCAFWDLYEAMGGKNSMPSWVFAEPALANKDFTHFTPKGAMLVSEMLFKALMSEYEKYRRL